MNNIFKSIIFFGFITGLNLVASELHKFKFVPVDGEYKCVKQSTRYYPYASDSVSNRTPSNNIDMTTTIVVATVGSVVAVGQYAYSFFWRKKEEKVSSDAKKAHTAVQRLSLDQLYVLATQEQEANSPSRYFRDKYEAALHINGGGDGV